MRLTVDSGTSKPPPPLVTRPWPRRFIWIHIQRAGWHESCCCYTSCHLLLSNCVCCVGHDGAWTTRPLRHHIKTQTHDRDSRQNTIPALFKLLRSARIKRHGGSLEQKIWECGLSPQSEMILLCESLGQSSKTDLFLCALSDKGSIKGLALKMNKMAAGTSTYQEPVLRIQKQRWSFCT